MRLVSLMHVLDVWTVVEVRYLELLLAYLLPAVVMELDTIPAFSLMGSLLWRIIRSWRR
jgi:hypothetical protein